MYFANARPHLQLHLGRKNRQDKRPKVAWAVLIAPRQNGGLGLMDPESQCKGFVRHALLSKFVCRAMLPMQCVWSQLMMHRMSTMCLTIGGIWRPSLKWAFYSEFSFV